MSREQLSAFNAVIKDLDSIFVDMAVWVPFWVRFSKRHRFIGMIMNEEGLFEKVEIMGPPTYEAWEACWNIFITACIMFNIIDEGKLRRYMKFIRRLARKHDDKCWPLIYQAEVRMRLERASEIREELEEQHELDLQNGWRTHFNPARPWDAVWEKILSGSGDWWWRNVEQPCLLITCNVKTVADYVDGDAPVAASAMLMDTLTGTTTANNTTRGKKRPRAQLALLYYADSDTAAAGTNEKQDLSKWDPAKQLYVLNKQGKDFCPGFGTGRCTDTGPNNTCSHHKHLAHQCQFCLRTGHGYQRCRFNLKTHEEEKPNKGKGAKEKALPWKAKKAGGKNKGKGGKQ